MEQSEKDNEEACTACTNESRSRNGEDLRDGCLCCLQTAQSRMLSTFTATHCRTPVNRKGESADESLHDQDTALGPRHKAYEYTA